MSSWSYLIQGAVFVNQDAVFLINQEVRRQLLIRFATPKCDKISRRLTSKSSHIIIYYQVR